MNVEIKELKYRIELGDLFVDCSNRFYVLTLVSNGCALINLNGNGHWDDYESLAVAIENISHDIKVKNLIHLSKKQYKLVLESILDKN